MGAKKVQLVDRNITKKDNRIEVGARAPTHPLAQRIQPVGLPVGLLVTGLVYCSAYVRIHFLVSGLALTVLSTGRG
jgi:hypothetical protein